MSIYRVAKKYTKGPEQNVENFNDINDAKMFIQKKLQEDAAMRMVTMYLLYDEVDLLETFDQSTLAPVSSEEHAGSSGKSSSHGHRPSPIQTTLRPSGMPPVTSKADDDKGK